MAVKLRADGIAQLIRHTHNTYIILETLARASSTFNGEYMTWTYHQNSRKLLHDNVEISEGYSGKGDEKNKHDKQDVTDRGPIPVGKYTLNGGPFKHYKTGVYTIKLLPDPSNEMFGRDNFMIHGDSIKHPGEASKGCIVLPLDIRKKIWQSGDHKIEVEK